VGAGLAEVALIAVLTVVVLPCCFFILLALLDRFERSLAPTAERPVPVIVPTTATLAGAALPAGAPEVEGSSGDVRTLSRGSKASPTPTAAPV
jgi:hypothetical protein